MADESTQADGSVEGNEGVNSPANQTPEPPAGSGSGSGSGAEGTISLEEARKLRSENKSLRDRAKTAESRVQEFESQGKSREEKMQAELEKTGETVSKLTAANRSLQVQVLASEVGIVDPLAAAKLVDWDTVEDVTDRDAVKAALENVAKAHPALVEARPERRGVDAGAGAGRRGRPPKAFDFNAEIRRKAGYSA